MTRFMVRTGIVSWCLLNLATRAGAVPIDVRLEPVDNSSGGAELEGFTTTDIVLTIPDVYTGSQLFIQLQRGRIFQHPLGEITAPHPTLLQLFPSIEFDTYVAHGTNSVNGPIGAFNVTGAAVNLDQSGFRPLTFSESLIDIAWHPQGGNLPSATENFLAARITLSDDAQGRWLYLASSGREWTVVTPRNHPVQNRGEGATPVVSAGSGLIRTGELQLVAEIPEPAAFVLALTCLVLGAVVVRQSRPWGERP